jgi:hypothetical protein
MIAQFGPPRFVVIITFTIKLVDVQHYPQSNDIVNIVLTQRLSDLSGFQVRFSCTLGERTCARLARACKSIRLQLMLPRHNVVVILWFSTHLLPQGVHAFPENPSIFKQQPVTFLYAGAMKGLGAYTCVRV